jgi:hypothetical protein
MRRNASTKYAIFVAPAIGGFASRVKTHTPAAPAPVSARDCGGYRMMPGI